MSTNTDWPVCLCGCGEPVEPSPRNHARDGLLKGGPTKYAKGHSPRARAGDPLKRYAEDPNTGCWLWQGDLLRGKGYGCLDVDGRKVRAHRFFYEQHVGPLDADTILHHTCENRRCVNPSHLQPMSQSAHMVLHHAERRESVAA